MPRLWCKDGFGGIEMSEYIDKLVFLDQISKQKLFYEEESNQEIV